MRTKNTLIIFQDKKIRRVWYNNEWFYSIIDVVDALETSTIPKRYWSDLKVKLLEEGFEPYDKIVQLKLPAEDAKLRETDCANIRNMFRIIQSVPSPKAEPFKQWLAKIGQERIQEIENPELAQNRVREYYERKGYPKDWIEKRLRGIAIRQQLTNEWKNRGIQEEKDFAILTNEISLATFDKTVDEYRQFKGLNRLNQNLRDHMTDWELILNMIGEKATTDITVARNAVGFTELKHTAKEGGDIAKNTRKELEQKIGRLIVSKENYLEIEKKRKLIGQN